MKVMNKGLQEFQLKKQIERHLDSDRVDIDSHIDETLTLSENISQFKRMGFIQQTFNMIEEQAEEYSFISEHYRCRKCGNQNLNIRRYDSHKGKQTWVIVDCNCGFWNGFFDTTNYYVG